MTPTRRARVIGFAATAAAIPLLLSSAAGATATLGQGDEFYVPAPSACAGFLWTANPPKALSSLDPRFVISGLTIQPGTISVTEVVTWDGREVAEHPLERAEQAEQTEQTESEEDVTPAVEKNEQLRIEYYNGSTFLGASSVTPDLQDDKAFAWAVTPLTNIATFQVADRVEIVHASEFMATDDTINAFYPKSVCIVATPKQTQTTTTVQQTTTTAPTTTMPATTVAPTTTAPATVLAATLEAAPPVQPVLAYTGDHTATKVGIGVALLGLGAGLVTFGRRRETTTA